MAETKMMSFMQHLGDLRKKITVSLIAVCVTFMIAFTYSEDILRFFMFPLRYTLDFSVRKMYLYYVYQDKLHDTKLVFLSPTEGFWMNMAVFTTIRSACYNASFSIPVCSVGDHYLGLEKDRERRTSDHRGHRRRPGQARHEGNAVKGRQDV